MEDLPFIPSLRRRGKRGGSKCKTMKGENSMINIKNILCPIDYSIYSEKALSYAIEFAGKYGAKLFLMHVLDIRVYDINDPDLYNVNIVDKETINKLRERLLKCVNEDTKGRISVEAVLPCVPSTIRSMSYSFDALIISAKGTPCRTTASTDILPFVSSFTHLSSLSLSLLIVSLSTILTLYRSGSLMS